jgi:biotin transport system substrate-specific component
MSTASSVIQPQPRLFVELLPRAKLVNVAVVVAFAGALGLSAQVQIPLGFTPVPLTLQTLVVLGGAAALGSWRAFLGSAIYLALGLVGVPWFAGGSGGLQVAHAPTFGYLVGFLAAAVVVGYLASRGFDRTFLGMGIAMIVGNLVIYSFGVLWLAASLQVSLVHALSLGVVPFLIGDVIKIAVADLSFPLAWKAYSHRSSERS